MSRRQSISFLAFPTSNWKSVELSPGVRKPPYLPFRRISLPASPSMVERQFLISTTSSNSLPGDGLDASLDTKVARVQRGKTAQEFPLGPSSRRRTQSIRSPRDKAKEARRRKVIEEFYETERAYVDGLELVYSHFLTPIIDSLETAHPLMERTTLTAMFSNFIDIWNLHRSFFFALSSLLASSNFFPSSSFLSTPAPETPAISSVLLAHFPYLSLYTPFISSFPTTITTLTDIITSPSCSRPNPQYNATFALFLQAQEADPRCGNLKLRDWLLSIVQRCPRYLLLLKDLINCTAVEDDEHEKLVAAHAIVSKTTTSLNTSLHTHSQTLSLIALQRSTSHLPFPLVSPGRTLIKRGPLLQIERSEPPREREFLLFSDCLLWLAPEESERVGWGIPWSSSSISNKAAAADATSYVLAPATRTRSKSAVDLPSTSDAPVVEGRSEAGSPRKLKSCHPPPSPLSAMNTLKRRSARSSASIGAAEERWVYKGRAALVDLEVVVTPTLEEGEERRWEVLSPEGSFTLYAGTESERDAWTASVRQAKAQLIVALSATKPNSTLTSSASTHHVRRSLQALPFHPSDDRIATLRGSIMQSEMNNDDVNKAAISGRPEKGVMLRKKRPEERRGRVEHWIPAIWVPDERTDVCMHCGRAFGWRRRRHHCRLCGHCVCAACSGRTFFVADTTVCSSPQPVSKPARACDTCYEAVFPLLPIKKVHEPAMHSESDLRTSVVQTTVSHPDLEATVRASGSGSISSLDHLPSCLSMPALPVRSARTLLALDVGAHDYSDKDVHLKEVDKKGGHKHLKRAIKGGICMRESSLHSGEGGHGWKCAVHQPQSCSPLVAEFAMRSREVLEPTELYGRPEELMGDEKEPLRAEDTDVDAATEEEGDICSEPEAWFKSDSPSTPLAISCTLNRGAPQGATSPHGSLSIQLEHSPQHAASPCERSSVHLSSQRISGLPGGSRKSGSHEDIVRQRDRFALPAIALQATSVTAQTAGGGRRSHRFSLIPKAARAGGGNVTSDDSGLQGGIAATRLNELLGRTAVKAKVPQ